MKAETLKKSILQYAMQGKLVAQDPNDEPASELLKRIKLEKEQLIKDGKIKKEKPLPPITEDEIPYELPNGWEWVRLGSIISISSGKFLPSNEMKQDGNIPVYGGNGINGYHNEYLIDKPTLIIGRVGFYCGCVHLSAGKAWVTDNAFITTFSQNNININFLKWLLTASDLGQNDNATAQPVVSGKKIYPLIVALPPLEEQQRIVEKLEQILPLVDEYGKNEEKLSKLNSTLPDKIKQSILQYAVQGKLVEQNPNDEPASELLKRIKAEKEQLIKDGKIKKEKTLQPILEDEIPFQIPKSWQWVKLDDISNIISGNNFLSEDFNTISGAKVIKITNVGVNQFIETDDYLPLEYQNKYPEFLVNKKDILIALTRSYIKEGLKVCICPLEYNQSLLNQRVASIKIFSNEILQAYIYLYLSSKYVLDYVKFESKTMNQPNLSIKSLKNLYVPLPPLAEQQRIVAKVEELMQIVDVLE